MPDTENGTESQQETRERVLQAAFNRYSHSPAPDWVKFFREVLGLNGIVRRTYRTPEELAELSALQDLASRGALPGSSES